MCAYLAGRVLLRAAGVSLCAGSWWVGWPWLQLLTYYILMKLFDGSLSCEQLAVSSSTFGGRGSVSCEIQSPFATKAGAEILDLQRIRVDTVDALFWLLIQVMW